MKKQYIDKAVIKVELERTEHETNYEPFTDEVLGKRFVCRSLLSFLDTLEVKEEVFDINDIKDAFKSGYDMGVLQTTKKMKSNTKEVDLEKEIELVKGDYEQVDVAWNDDFDFIARHFYELGLKARKGE